MTGRRLDEVTGLCDRVGLLDRGRLHAELTPAALVAEYGTTDGSDGVAGRGHRRAPGRPESPRPSPTVCAGRAGRLVTAVVPGRAGVGGVVAGGRVWAACSAAVVGIELRRWRRRPAALVGALVLPAVVAAVLEVAGLGRCGPAAAVAVLVLALASLVEAWVGDRRSGVDERLATTVAPASAVLAGRAAGMGGVAAASLGGAALAVGPGGSPAAVAVLVLGAAAAVTGGAALVAAGRAPAASPASRSSPSPSSSPRRARRGRRRASPSRRRPSRTWASAWACWASPPSCSPPWSPTPGARRQPGAARPGWPPSCPPYRPRLGEGRGRGA